jgi:hypothetical protein
VTAIPQGLGLVALDQAGFSMTPSVRAQALVVKVCGNGDMAVIEALGRYLKQVHREALHLASAEVELDFRELYFMNSSCLKALVTWIDSAGNNGQPLYRIRFLTDPKLLWQRRSLEALRRLAPEIVQIET